MEGITPARRDPAVQIRLGPTNTGSEVVAASQRVVRSIGSGRITPSEGEKITSVLENRRKVIETAELDSRIANLEEAQGKNEVPRHSRYGPNGGRSCAPNGRPTIDRDYLRRSANRDAVVEHHFSSYFKDLLLLKLRVRIRSPHRIHE